MKTTTIQTMLGSLREQVLAASDRPATVQGMRTLREAYRELATARLTPDPSAALQWFYTDDAGIVAAEDLKAVVCDLAVIVELLQRVSRARSGDRGAVQARRKAVRAADSSGVSSISPRRVRDAITGREDSHARRSRRPDSR